MSQAITEFTNISTTITAEYKSGTETSDGKFILGIRVKKAFEKDVSFSSSLSLGDFSTLSVDNSSLSVGGSFELYNEFGVILGSDDKQGLKMLRQISEADCERPEFELTLTLYHDQDTPVEHTITMNTCSNGGAEARKDALNDAFNKSITDNDEVSVSLVGTSTIVLAFNPYWTKVQTSVPDVYTDNVYGMANDTKIKGLFQFANGFTSLDANLGVTGSAVVSARILDSIEAGATIDSFVTGSLAFESGTRGVMIPLEEWFSNIRSIVDPTDDFYDPDFSSAIISLDGHFKASVELREPFALDLPVSAKGFFVTPFELDLLDQSTNNTARPNVQFDIELPNIGDLGNLSFGGKLKWLVFVLPLPREANKT